ncbi:MAG TPA: hypothetical protein H9684_03940 [Firmicutes bacterium]|nr:hypothetical protein [Bacillota bacterium]
MVKRSAGRRLLAVFYPERCACCRKPVPCGALACGECRAALPAIPPPVCPLCGAARADCACRGRRRTVERLTAPFYYEGGARRAVRHLKFNGHPDAAELLYTAMAETVRREYGGRLFDAVIPVPVGPATLRRRGYNQSAVLAKGLAEELGLPMEEALVKLWDTTPQRELPADRRGGNVFGVFDRAESADFAGKALLLVDDVATTGATLDECAKMLKLYGAREVYAVAAALSRLSKEKK